MLHTGKSLIETQVFVGEAFVVDAQSPEDCSVEVVDVHGIFDDVVGEIICLAIFKSRFESTARHPHGKATSMMVAPMVVLGQFSLRINGSSKFTSTDHDRILEQPTLFEILDQCSGGLIDVLGLTTNLLW